MKQILFSFFLSILSLTSFAQFPTVVDVIVNSADHDTLEAAVLAAGLADDLSGTGPFTVFAPTDAAFANLPAGTIEALLADPTGDLTQILLYHVVGAQALSTDLTTGQMITTLQGIDVTVTIGTNGVMINNAMVTVADIVTDNGVVHVIDAVLIPQIANTVSQIETSYFTFPNPVNSYINIPTTNNVNVQIMTVGGQMVLNQNFNGSVNINTDNLSNGIYVMKLSGNNYNQVCKFVK